MSIFGMSPEFFVIPAASVDLLEVADGRLKFRDGKSGVATAKFMISPGEAWRKIRLTYRRPGKNLRLENYVVARLNQIRKTTMATETLTFATSQNHVTDTDQIRSILGVKTLLEPLDYTDFFYHVEVVMRRSPMLVSPDFPVEGVLTFSGVHTLSGPEAAVMAEPEFGETETPSVPIPPPTKAETAAITALREFALGFPPTFGVLTPSPECLLVELATTAPGFG